MKSAEELEKETKKICEVYQRAEEYRGKGIKLYSTDECTGIQAKERLYAERPMKKGKARRVEYEYLRHGTLGLMANFEVATGKLESSTISETRTEADFVKHIEKTVWKTPEATRGGGLFWIN